MYARVHARRLNRRTCSVVTEETKDLFSFGLANVALRLGPYNSVSSEKQFCTGHVWSMKWQINITINKQKH